MLDYICQYLRNWFDVARYVGQITIADGQLVGFDDKLADGQYFRIVGSLFNDGVYQHPATLNDEAFDGAVWAMAVPPSIIQLDADIETWVQDNAETINSPYASESFGGYSYSLRSGTDSSGNAVGASWQNQFAARLAPWRKI